MKAEIRYNEITGETENILFIPYYIGDSMVLADTQKELKSNNFDFQKPIKRIEFYNGCSYIQEFKPEVNIDES